MLKDGDEDGQVWFHQVTGLNVRSEYIPFIIGTFASITLILVLLLAYVLWHCCISTNKKNVQGMLHFFLHLLNYYAWFKKDTI